MRKFHSRPRATEVSIDDPDAVALSSQQYIVRRAHRTLDGLLGRDNAESVASDIWLWLMDRRAAQPTFLADPRAFRKAIRRKLARTYRKAQVQLDRVDDAFDVERFVDAGTGGGTKRLTIPDEIFARSETIWYVQRAIAQLPLQMQRVIRLYDLDDWTADDVAVELGIRATTVRRIRHEAKTRLRELLKAFGGMKAA